MPKELTSQQLTDLIGIATITLARWQRQELIPPPEVRPLPSGRGKRGYWSEWVVDRCKQIKHLRQAGHSLAQIKKELGSDWEAESQAYLAKSKRRYRFEEVSRSISMRQCAESSSDAIVELVRRLNKKHAISIGPEHIANALEIALDGINPVLIVNNTETRVTADFVVADYLANCLSLHSAFVVVPLFEELQSQLKLTDKLPKSPTIRPSTELKKGKRRRKSKLRYWRFNSWDFEVREENEKKP